jgi:hypothetical protein
MLQIDKTGLLLTFKDLPAKSILPTTIFVDRNKGK